MRIATAQKKIIYDYWKDKEPSNQVYLFGSRVDDSKKGGDIDILVLSDKKLHHTDLLVSGIVKTMHFSAFRLSF
jgi:predicted nucleotidyltransferase